MSELWRRKWQPTPAFLLGESHGHRSLVGHSPCACKESDTTEQLILSLTLGKTSGEGLRLTNEDPAHRPGAGPPEEGQRGVEFSSVA